MATNNCWNNRILAANSAITLNAGSNDINVGTDISNNTISIGYDVIEAAAKLVNIGTSTVNSSISMRGEQIVLSTAVTGGSEVFSFQTSTTSFGFFNNAIAQVECNSDGIEIASPAGIAMTLSDAGIVIDTAAGTSLTISDDGEVNMPLQPSFLACLSATATNVTGTGSFYQYVANTEIWDIGGDYNNATGVFTAPITGKYALNASAALVGCTINTQISLKISTSNRDYQYNFNRAASSDDIQLNFTPICDMDVGDTTSFHILGAGEVADTDDVYGDGAPTGTSCSGWMLG